MNNQAERRIVRLGIHKTHNTEIYYYVEQTPLGRTIQLTDNPHGGPRSHNFPGPIIPSHVTYNTEIESLFNSTLISFYDHGKFFLGTSIPLSTASIDVDLVKNHDSFMRIIEAALWVMGWRINLAEATQARLDFENGKVGSPVLSPAWCSNLPVKKNGGKSEKVDRLVGVQWLDGDGNLCLRYTPGLQAQAQAQQQQRMMNVEDQRRGSVLHIQPNGSFIPLPQRVAEQHTPARVVHARIPQVQPLQQGPPEQHLPRTDNKRKIDGPLLCVLPSHRREDSYHPESDNLESGSLSPASKQLKTDHSPDISPQPKQEKQEKKMGSASVGFVDLTD